jgi:hypothetical protein
MFKKERKSINSFKHLQEIGKKFVIATSKPKNWAAQS